MIGTIIIEDDPAVLDKLCAAIDPADDIVVIGTASDVASGKQLIKKGGYDVLLTDLGLPGGSGVDLIRLSTKLYPESDVIVITIFANQNRVLDCVRAGAKGYLLKDDKLEDCAERIRLVRAGGSPISPIIARHLLRAMQPDPADVVQPLQNELSGREAEVLNLLARGFSYSEIGGLLDLRHSSVGTYVKRIYKKLEVNSRAEAVFEAGNRGIINVH
jgi:DNA-binding NarL/FixJ family response regulator